MGNDMTFQNSIKQNVAISPFLSDDLIVPLCHSDRQSQGCSGLSWRDASSFFWRRIPNTPKISKP